MRFTVVMIFMALSLNAYSQSLGPYLIGSQGAVLENSELQLYSSIGEPINTFQRSDDIMVSQGVLQSAQQISTSGFSTCSAKSGLMFFENCDDGTLFFFIKGDDGVTYDPYYADGVTFDNRDSIQVNFGFELLDFATPCAIADQAVLINCISEDVISNTTELYKTESVLIYPNPTSGFINIELEDHWEGQLQIQLIDPLGRKVIQDGSIQNGKGLASSLDIKSLPNGIYTLVISNNDALITKNIVLAK